jgi:hypothetical protein
MKTRQSDEVDFWPEGESRLSRKVLLIGAAIVVVILIVVAVVVVSLTGGGGQAAEKGLATPTVWVGTTADDGTAKLNLRSADQRALNEGEVFGNVKTVSHGKFTFNLVGSRISTDCMVVSWGKKLQDDLRKYGCTQFARGAYLSTDKRHVGQFIAINLDRLEGADQIVRDLDPHNSAGFIRPLTAPGVDTFGGGFSAAYGQPYGHYAIISWVQRNGGGRPDSMNELLDASVAIEGANDFVWQRLVLAGG